MKRFWLTMLGSVLVAGGVATPAAAQGTVPPGFQYHPDVYRLPAVPAEAPLTVPPADVTEPEFVIPEVDEVLAPKCPSQPVWSGGVEFGANGTEGNSQTFDFRFGVDAKRKTELNILTADLDYVKKTSSGEESAHRSYLDWKHERLFQESPWTAVTHGTVDYDEFKSYDVRTTVDLALGYRLVDTEITSFTARAGGGVAHEYGGPGEGWTPQAVFGMAYEHKINDRHKFTGDLEYTPEIESFSDYFMTSRASWEMVVDADMNLSLKLSVKNRYDSTSNDAEANDLDYSAVLLWSF